MRNSIELFARLSAIALLVAGIVLVAAAYQPVCALTPGTPAIMSTAAAPNSASPNPEGSVPTSPSPQTVKPRVPLGATLIGTAIVKGGPSFAVLMTADGSRVLPEGAEIVEGARLLQVLTDQIVVVREGLGQEILQFSDGKAVTRSKAPTADLIGDMPNRAQTIRERMQSQVELRQIRMQHLQ